MTDRHQWPAQQCSSPVPPSDMLVSTLALDTRHVARGTTPGTQHRHHTLWSQRSALVTTSHTSRVTWPRKHLWQYETHKLRFQIKAGRDDRGYLLDCTSIIRCYVTNSRVMKSLSLISQSSWLMAKVRWRTRAWLLTLTEDCGCGWSPVMCLLSHVWELLGRSRHVSRYTIYCEQDTRAMQGEDGRKLLWRRAELRRWWRVICYLHCAAICYVLHVMLDNKTREVASTAASCHCKMSGAECLRLILNRSRDTGWMVTMARWMCWLDIVVPCHQLVPELVFTALVCELMLIIMLKMVCRVSQYFCVGH